MVIWLAVFYSALCEYHGLMLPFGPSMAHAHPNRTVASMVMPAHYASMNNLARSESGKRDTFMQFSRVPLSAVAMSFLTIVAPATFNLRPLQQESSLVVAHVSITHQCSLLPPEKPPRLLPFV